jgi:hypothetical protein
MKELPKNPYILTVSIGVSGREVKGLKNKNTRKIVLKTLQI